MTESDPELWKGATSRMPSVIQTRMFLFDCFVLLSILTSVVILTIYRCYHKNCTFKINRHTLETIDMV